MSGLRSLHREACGQITRGAVLVLALMTLSPQLATTQEPRTPTTPLGKTPLTSAVWQEVAFDFHIFLQLHTGWYRLKSSNIYFVIYPDMASMARAFDRMAYFIEISETKGRIVASHTIKGNVFYGHDYDLGDVARFFTHAKRQGARQHLFREERMLKERLLEQHLMQMDTRENYTGQARTALLGFARATTYPAYTSPRPLDIYIHEIFHGIWFTTDYRYDVASYWQRIPAQEQKSILEILYQRARYDLHDLALMQREFASYFRDYIGQDILSSGAAQQLGVEKLEEYQRELRKIERPYIRALGGSAPE